jgi:hypothetical protein
VWRGKEDNVFDALDLVAIVKMKAFRIDENINFASAEFITELCNLWFARVPTRRNK